MLACLQDYSSGKSIHTIHATYCWDDDQSHMSFALEEWFFFNHFFSEFYERRHHGIKPTRNEYFSLFLLLVHFAPAIKEPHPHCISVSIHVRPSPIAITGHQYLHSVAKHDRAYGPFAQHSVFSSVGTRRRGIGISRRGCVGSHREHWAPTLLRILFNHNLTDEEEEEWLAIITDFYIFSPVVILFFHTFHSQFKGERTRVCFWKWPS